MSKAKNKNTRNIYKPAVIILSIILAAVVICNIAYFSYLSVKQSQAEKQLAQAVDTAVTDCLDILDKFGMTEAQQDYISTYQENMENCETILQKAYIANSMLTYAATSTNMENSNNVTDIYNSGSIGQSKNYLVNDLNSTANRLQAAIYDYTVYNED